MENPQVLLFLAISFASSALGGILGMAGGVFIVPLLTMVVGVDMHTAIKASVVSVIACSCASAGLYLKEKLTHFRLAMILEVATTLGALLGVFFIGSIPDVYLILLFSFILFLSAQQMFAKRNELSFAGNGKSQSWVSKLELHGSYVDREKGRVDYSIDNLPLGMVLMFFAGLVSALLGIGSGVLKIPAMDSALKLPIKVSSATSNFMIGVTAAASAGAYFIQGEINAEIAGPVVLGSVLGSLFGAKILISLKAQRIRVIFVFILLGLAVQMLYSAVKGFIHG